MEYRLVPVDPTMKSIDIILPEDVVVDGSDITVQSHKDPFANLVNSSNSPVRCSKFLRKFIKSGASRTGGGEISLNGKVMKNSSFDDSVLYIVDGLNQERKKPNKIAKTLSWVLSRMSPRLVSKSVLPYDTYM
jgi:hypothetical protein